MEQNYFNSQNDFLWTLLANPANDASVYAYNLQRLVNDFPQSGILQALLVHASDEKNLKQASVYFNPRSLYKLINNPSSFTGVADERIIIQPALNGVNSHANGYNAAPVITQPVAEVAPVTEVTESNPLPVENYFNEPAFSEIEKNLGEDSEPLTHSFSLQEEGEGLENRFVEQVPPATNEIPVWPGDEIAIAPELNTRAAEVPEIKETAVQPVEIENALNHEAVLPPDTAAPVSETELKTAEPVQAHIEAEPVNDFPTIAPVEQHTEEAPVAAHQPEIKAVSADVEEPNEPAAPPVENNVAAQEDKEEEKLIIENIASADFFRFDNTFGDGVKAEPEPAKEEEKEEVVTEQPVQAMQETAPETDQQDVSRYHDEKMPYSFMWWLDKTRREHAGTYQPYIKPETGLATTEKKAKPRADELQQQYYENIFHITSVEELEKSTSAHMPPQPPPAHQPEQKRKEQVIIDRFIQEEPQIRPQSSDKLDNENKAKKSSEDRDELVTETLAAIYAEQMLYHKAIASYKKLMLKFPEKSRYFADKIEQLEKKTS